MMMWFAVAALPISHVLSWCIKRLVSLVVVRLDQVMSTINIQTRNEYTIAREKSVLALVSRAIRDYPARTGCKNQEIPITPAGVCGNSPASIVLPAVAVSIPITVAAFDYNGNGRIDFADVVWLFNNL